MQYKILERSTLTQKESLTNVIKLKLAFSLRFKKNKKKSLWFGPFCLKYDRLTSLWHFKTSKSFIKIFIWFCYVLSNICHVTLSTVVNINEVNWILLFTRTPQICSNDKRKKDESFCDCVIWKTARIPPPPPICVPQSVALIGKAALKRSHVPTNWLTLTQYCWWSRNDSIWDLMCPILMLLQKIWHK